MEINDLTAGIPYIRGYRNSKPYYYVRYRKPLDLSYGYAWYPYGVAMASLSLNLDLEFDCFAYSVRDNLYGHCFSNCIH